MFRNTRGHYLEIAPGVSVAHGDLLLQVQTQIKDLFARDNDDEYSENHALFVNLLNHKLIEKLHEHFRAHAGEDSLVETQALFIPREQNWQFYAGLRNKITLWSKR